MTRTDLEPIMHDPLQLLSKRFVIFLSLTFVLMTDSSLSAKPPYQLPTSRRVDQVDDYHGTKVADPYRWLEDDVRESAEVAEWVAEENAVTRAYLDGIPVRQKIIDRLTKLWNYARYGTPSQAGGKYFYSKNDGLQDQAVLYVAEDYGSEGRVLLDPNTWSEDGTVALAAGEPSGDGKFFAYQKSASGSDWRTIHILKIDSLNADSGEHFDEELEWVRFSSIEWNHDNSGFYYNRYPEPEEGEEFQSVALNPAVYFHRLDTPQSADVLVYKRPDHPDWHFGIEETDDGKYLLLTIEKSTDAKNQLYYRDAKDNSRERPPRHSSSSARPGTSETESPINNGTSSSDANAKWKPLIADFENQFQPIGSDGHRVFLLTDYEAPTKRIVAMDLDSPGRDKLAEVIPASKATLESANVLDGRLVAEYLEDVVSRVKVFGLDGVFQRDVPLPGVGNAGGFGGKSTDTETFFSFTSFNTPTSVYRYDLQSGEVSLVRRPEVAFDPEDYIVKQVFYESKDGTRVPMFVAHRADLEIEGNTPTLLYGYGGFSISLPPYFSVSRLAWMEMGGVMAVANLRGGGEYGEAWHLAGKLDKKQNVFDDFIAAAEWLVDHGYTKPQRLGIQGGSNGGLLVGAVMAQRPDLFGACLPAVGVMDMLRFHQFTAGRFWTAEYGSADVAEQFPALLAYSPYHNLKPGTSYPATLITTADTDDRVVPMHSFKFAAELQHSQAGNAPVMIRIETKAGHGRGTPTSKQIEQVADLWAFLAENLGMEVE